MYRFSNMDFQYGSAIWLLPLQNAQSANSLLSPWYGIFPQGGSFSYLVVCIETLPAWKEQSCVLTGIDTYSNLHFPPLCELVAQSYPTLCEPMDCSPPGSSAHGIFQARILEWVAISFSRGSSQPRS